MLSAVLVGFVALEHLGFLILEMFYWRKPLGLNIFRLTQSAADSSAALAANQGLYNGFLAAGLVWGLLIADPLWAGSIKTFFLSCVFIAGIFGAWTASPRILWLQAAPALAALISVRLLAR
jgi:putative membrane protein